MPYLDLGDERIYYSHSRPKSDDGEHPPLVLIHGAGGSHLHWPPQLRRLPDGHVYALDLPGHGKSSGAGRTSIADYREIVRTFAQALGLDAFVLGGHSMGSAIALDFGRTYPELLAGLILVGAGARLRVAPAILEGIQTDFTGTTEMITRWAHGPNVDRKTFEEYVKRLRETKPQVLHDDFAACDVFDIRPELRQIHLPALILCGTEDKLTPPKYSQYLHEQLAGSRLELIPDAGHMVMLERPATVTEAIQRFLDELVE